jgi:cell division septum initiation protein DivIVA
VERWDRKDLQDAPFDVALRGYDRRQVDERIRLLCAELDATEQALRAAQQRVVTLEDEVNQVRSGTGPGGRAFGARVEKILLTAEQEAREGRDQARAEAAALVEQAKAEADKVRKTARGEAGRLVEQARIEAERLVAMATESAQQREQVSAQELQRLSGLQDQISVELHRAKSVLDGFFSGPVIGDAGHPAPAGHPAAAGHPAPAGHSGAHAGRSNDVPWQGLGQQKRGG